MRFSFKPLDQQVIVITGASSGIGLATACAATAYGARLVLASRNEEALTDIVRQLRDAGAEAIHVAADVGHRSDVQRIADAALQHFGGFDTWVNNAGHSIYGRLDEVSDSDHKRLFQTNFWGVVYGSLIAVEHLKRKGGALINMGSVASDNAIPMQGMYSASKHAVKAFTDALRMELDGESAPVSVTLIKPTGIDTPFPQHARNYMDREPKLPPPVYPPEEVARAVMYAATHAKRDIYVGGAAKATSVISRLAPGTMSRVSSRLTPRQQKRDELPRDPEGTLYHAGMDGRIRGDHPGRVMGSSLYTRASINPVMTSAILAGAAFAATALVRRGYATRMTSRRSRHTLESEMPAMPDLTAKESVS